MRSLISAAIAVVLLSGVIAAERRWQTGTWFSAGVKRNSWAVSGAGAAVGVGARPTPPEVGIYVIDSAEVRLELEDIVPIDASAVEADLKIGGPVTFALEKNSVYIKGVKGVEYRLRVTKKTIKAAK